VENNPDSTPWYTGSTGAAGSTGDGDTEKPLLEKAKQQTQQVIEQTQQKAGEAMDRARDQVKSQVATQKERARDSLEGVAQALHQTGQQLREANQGVLGEYAEGAARMVERVSGYLDQRNIDQLVGEVEAFGRRQPGLFLGGAFALGFLAARFLKSSSPYGRSTTFETSSARYAMAGRPEYDAATMRPDAGIGSAARGSAGAGTE
jgi:hypothetical protein